MNLVNNHSGFSEWCLVGVVSGLSDFSGCGLVTLERLPWRSLPGKIQVLLVGKVSELSGWL